MGRHYGAVNPRDPVGYGTCDYSGDIVKRTDLVKQMAWRGNKLVWTGFMVSKHRADPPHDQQRTPILPPDPVPVLNARPDDAGDGEGLLYTETVAEFTYFIDTGEKNGNSPIELQWT